MHFQQTQWPFILVIDISTVARRSRFPFFVYSLVLCTVGSRGNLSSKAAGDLLLFRMVRKGGLQDLRRGCNEAQSLSAPGRTTAGTFYTILNWLAGECGSSCGCTVYLWCLGTLDNPAVVTRWEFGQGGFKEWFAMTTLVFVSNARRYPGDSYHPWSICK